MVSDVPDEGASNAADNVAYSCLNCETPLTGPYCAECGQKDIGARLNGRLMVYHLFESMTDLKSTPWRTLIELVKNPGRVSLNYIRGARTSYINPIRYLITTFAIYIGFLAANGWLDIAFTQRIPSGEEGSSPFGLSELFPQLVEGVRNLISEKRDILTFAIVPVYAFALRWFFFKSQRNFAETLTFTCYVLGQVQLYYFLFALVPFFVDGLEFTGRPPLVLALVIMLSVFGFYGSHWLKSILMGVLAFLLYILVTWYVAFGLAYMGSLFSTI